MNSISLDIPQKDVDDMFAAMKRAVDEVGKTGSQALAWGGATLCDSLRASTKSAPKKRALVTRKLHGIERTGVEVYTAKGLEFRALDVQQGVRTFKSRTTNQTLGVEVATGKVHRLKHWQMRKSDLADHPMRTIHKAGLAKRAWSVAKGKLVGRLMQRGAFKARSNLATVEWERSLQNPSVTITNELNYAVKAFKTTGKQAVATAMRRAADNMERRIDRAMKKV